jgi:hypothetical protein
MTIQELNELIERVAAQPGIRECEEMKLLGWMLDHREHHATRAQQDNMTIQELNELIQHRMAQPGLREHQANNLLSWMLEYQAA